MHYSVRCGDRGLRPMPIVARLCFMFRIKNNKTIKAHPKSAPRSVLMFTQHSTDWFITSMILA